MFTIDVVVYQDEGRFAAATEGLSLKSLPPEALRLTSGTGDSPKQTAGADPASRSAGPDVAAGGGGPMKRAGRERRRALVGGAGRPGAGGPLGVAPTMSGPLPPPPTPPPTPAHVHH